MKKYLIYYNLIWAVGNTYCYLTSNYWTNGLVAILNCAAVLILIFFFQNVE